MRWFDPDDYKNLANECVLSELKIDPDLAFPAVGRKTAKHYQRKAFRNSLHLDDPIEATDSQRSIFAPYQVRSDGQLKPRPEAFAKFMAENNSTTLECFVKAGYSPGKTAAANARILSRKPEVQARIAQLRTYRWRLEHAGSTEIHDVITKIDAGDAPEIDYPMLIRQWAVNLDMARKMGDAKGANRALEMISRLADYDGKYTKSDPIRHKEDRPTAEDNNHTIEDELAGTDANEKRKRTPPSTAELIAALQPLDRNN